MDPLQILYGSSADSEANNQTSDQLNQFILRNSFLLLLLLRVLIFFNPISSIDICNHVLLIDP